MLAILAISIQLTAASQPAHPRPCFPPYVDEHLIPFDSGSDSLSVNSAWLVRVAYDYGSPGHVTYRITSRADTVGSLVTNQRLSEARGQAIATELVRLGASSASIVISATGEQSLLKATADDVSEALNRIGVIEVVNEPGSPYPPEWERRMQTFCAGR